MNRRLPKVAVLWLFVVGTGLAAVEAANPPVRKPFGIAKRIPWTTSRVVGSPDPPDPYRTEVAFPKIRFDSPLAMNVVPGTNRLAVVERYGKIYTFDNRRDVAGKTLLIDLKRTAYGIAVHPNYAKNGYVFITNIIDADRPTPRGTRISRFTVKDPKTFRADPKSEKVIIEWPSGGHNGGCLRFGPDGFLYISAGDSSGIADELKTGQDIRDLSGSILRIDVDRTQGKRNYSIPKDNPFVNTPGARPEIFSYGHRQLWKFSFTRDGLMWGGEIGQDLWEMIHILKKGGNYGWSVMEGSHPFRPNRPKGPTPFVKPIIEHNHNDFRSIVGGYVSYSNRLPELKGAHIYGDYDTGRIWTFRYQAGKVTRHYELTDTTLRVVAFGTDNAGEVYAVDFVGGQLHRLVKSPPSSKSEPKFPRKLSETGLFTSTKDLTPAPGLIPYSVNSPLYSDGAAKDRFIALPLNSKIEFDAVVYPQPAPGAPPGWRFPDGTVLVKTFSLELEPGNPKSLRRLETRILHYKRMTGVDDEYGAQVWLGYTYVWNDEQTDAFLLDAKGLDKTFAIKDPQALGGVRKQKWHFPSRAECTLCHTMSAKYVLGVNTLQMNKDHDYGGLTANQLATLNHIGVFKKPLTKKPAQLPAIVDYRDKSKSVERRARAYLHANCSHCHRKWGGGNAEFQLLASMNLYETGTINVRPGQGTFQLKDPRILVPGDPNRSMLLHRMRLLKLGRMPHVASTVLDRDGIALITAWIRGLPKAEGKFIPLFNGRNLAGWKGPHRSTNGDWKTAAAVPLDKSDNRKFALQSGTGVLVNGDKGRTVNLFTVPEHGDCELHVEFCVPKGSNSGVYLQGRYEIQILDSFGVKKLKYGDCGGIYTRIVNGKPLGGRAPNLNASKPPGEWQSFDITFRAPRFDKSGKKTRNARFVKVFHNGKLIHENVDVTGPTVAAAFGDEKPKGPIMLQGDHGPVAYRNLKIRNLKLD
jgi:uncharacterized repeat protein (TIGR03806 family)